MRYDHYSGRTASLTSKSCILYIYSTNIGTEYFKHGIHPSFFPLQTAVCFIILTYLVPVLFIFYIQDVLKLKKKIPAPKALKSGHLHKVSFSLISCSFMRSEKGKLFEKLHNAELCRQQTRAASSRVMPYWCCVCGTVCQSVINYVSPPPDAFTAKNTSGTAIFVCPSTDV